MEVSDSLSAWKAAVKSGSTPEASPLFKVFTPEIKAEDGESRRVKFVISTGAVDRDNDTLSVNGWDLGNYLKNPAVLFAHDSRSLPIGRAVSVQMEGGALVAVAEFATADMNPLADSVYKMLKAGFLKATSVGFLPKPNAYKFNELRGGYDFQAQELLEFSVVPVPSNPEALMQLAKHAGIDTAPIRKWAETFLDIYRKDDLQLIEQRVAALSRTVSVLVGAEKIVPLDKAGRKLSAAALESLAGAKSAMDDMAGHCGAIGATVKALADAYTKGAAHLDALLEDPAEPDADDKAQDVHVVKLIEEPRFNITAADVQGAVKEAVNDALRRHTGRLD